MEKKKLAAIKGHVKKTVAAITVVAVILTAMPVTAEAASWKENNTGWWWEEDNGSYPANTWKTINSKKYAFDNWGYMWHGWYWDGKNWYYLGDVGDGAMRTGWLKDGDNWYYMGGSNDGAMKTGWMQDDGYWYYMGGSNDGAMRTGWLKDGDNWYYMGGSNDGAMKTGWLQDGDNWYYLYDDGKMAANTWVGDYYVNSSGIWTQTKQQLKWVKSGNRWWYCHSDGSYTKNGWETIDGEEYLFDGSGWMLTGWQKVGGTWYYLQASGAMLGQGWHWINDKCYYMYADGKMAADTWIGNDYVDGSGAWVKDEKKLVHEHSYDTLISNVEATCTSNGYSVYQCSCGATVQHDFTAFGHNWLHYDETIRTEYVTEGHTFCGQCGYDFGSGINIDDALGEHFFGSNSDGSCQNYYVKEVIIDEYPVVVEPAYDQCTNCGETR